MWLDAFMQYYSTDYLEDVLKRAKQLQLSKEDSVATITGRK